MAQLMVVSYSSFSLDDSKWTGSESVDCNVVAEWKSLKKRSNENKGLNFLVEYIDCIERRLWCW